MKIERKYLHGGNRPKAKHSKYKHNKRLQISARYLSFCSKEETILQENNDTMIWECNI